MLERRASLEYDHGHDAHKSYLTLASDPKYIEVVRRRVPGEGPARISENEDCLRSVREDGNDWEFVLETPKNGVEIRPGRLKGDRRG